MVRSVKYLISLVGAVLAVSCSTDYKEELVKQEGYIDQYIHSAFPECEVVRNNGVNRVIVSAGTDPVLAKGDSAYIIYEGHAFDGGSPVKEAFTVDSTFVRIGHNDLIKGLDDGLQGAKLGETAALLFSAKYGYGKDRVGLVPETSALMFLVQVQAIKKNK